MGKAHPIELRDRVVAFGNEGNSNREAARHVRVSPRFVNNMMILQRSCGSLAAAKQDHPASGTKLSAHSEWIRKRVTIHGEMTFDEQSGELVERGIEVNRATVGRFLHRLELSNKRSFEASEQLRPEIARAHNVWINHRKPFFTRLNFIDDQHTPDKTHRMFC